MIEPNELAHATAALAEARAKCEELRDALASAQATLDEALRVQGAIWDAVGGQRDGESLVDAVRRVARLANDPGPRADVSASAQYASFVTEADRAAPPDPHPLVDAIAGLSLDDIAALSAAGWVMRWTAPSMRWVTPGGAALDPATWRETLRREAARLTGKRYVVGVDGEEAKMGDMSDSSKRDVESVEETKRRLLEALPNYRAHGYTPSPSDVITDIAPAVHGMLRVALDEAREAGRAEAKAEIEQTRNDAERSSEPSHTLETPEQIAKRVVFVGGGNAVVLDATHPRSRGPRVEFKLYYGNAPDEYAQSVRSQLVFILAHHETAVRADASAEIERLRMVLLDIGRAFDHRSPEYIVDTAARIVAERDEARAAFARDTAEYQVENTKLRNDVQALIDDARKALGARSDETLIGAAVRVVSERDRFRDWLAEIRETVGGQRDESTVSAATRVVSERNAAYQRGQEAMREWASTWCDSEASRMQSRGEHSQASTLWHAYQEIRSLPIAKAPTVSASEVTGEAVPGGRAAETAGAGESVARSAPPANDLASRWKATAGARREQARSHNEPQWRGYHDGCADAYATCADEMRTWRSDDAAEIARLRAEIERQRGIVDAYAAKVESYATEIVDLQERLTEARYGCNRIEQVLVSAGVPLQSDEPLADTVRRALDNREAYAAKVESYAAEIVSVGDRLAKVRHERGRSDDALKAIRDALIDAGVTQQSDESLADAVRRALDNRDARAAKVERVPQMGDPVVYQYGNGAEEPGIVRNILTDNVVDLWTTALTEPYVFGARRGVGPGAWRFRD